MRDREYCNRCIENVNEINGLALFPTSAQLHERWLSLADNEAEQRREFCSPSEFMKYARITESRIRGRVSEGKLPAIQVYGRIYIHVPTALAQQRHALTCPEAYERGAPTRKTPKKSKTTKRSGSAGGERAVAS